MTTTETVTLSKPLKTHRGEVSALTLKEPTARLFLEYGEPFKSRVVKDENGEQSVEFDYNNKTLGKFLVDMIDEQVDDIILGGIVAADFYALRNRATQLILGIVGDKNPTQPSGE